MTMEPSFAAPDRVTVATVADLDGPVTAVIYCHLEPLLAEADLYLTVITIDGDVDSDTAPYLEYHLREAVSWGVPVCWDLARVGYFGAAGARIALSAAQQAAATGTMFLVRSARRMPRRVLEATGFDRHLIVE